MKSEVKPKRGKRPKRKPARASGAHATARRPVQFPADWDAVSQQLAERSGRPKVHYLIGLIAAAADSAGLAHPPAPVAT